MSNNKFYSSIIIEAPEPVDRRLIVETAEDTVLPKTKSDLVSIANRYPGMFVWVRDVKTFYYLRDAANGSSLSDWAVGGDGSKFVQWAPATPYVRGSGVFVGASGDLFYLAKTNNVGINPIGNPNDWLQVASSSGGLISANFTIASNAVPLGDPSRSLALNYSAIGDFPVVQVWLNVWNGSSADKVEAQPLLELDKNAVGAVANGFLRYTFQGKIDDIVSTGSGNSITGKITIR